MAGRRLIFTHPGKKTEAEDTCLYPVQVEEIPMPDEGSRTRHVLYLPFGELTAGRYCPGAEESLRGVAVSLFGSLPTLLHFILVPFGETFSGRRDSLFRSDTIQYNPLRAGRKEIPVGMEGKKLPL
jgi:hypothetical protein